MPPSFPRQPRPKTALAVVIPTFNRVEALRLCLEHLERQSFRDFAVIVVDDGSTDGTAAELERTSVALPLQVIRQQNAGPARARNRGIAAVEAPVTVLLGDDTFAQPDFLEHHYRFHRSHPEQEAVAIGLTRWASQGQTVTPFMHWLERDGVQFSFGELLAGGRASWKHFYTSNLSAKTCYLQQHRFDESFERYGLEDIELGYRLAQREGLQMSFLPQARVEHLHPTGFAQSCRRARVVGAAEHRLGAIWPEHRPRLDGPKQRLLRLFSHAPLLPVVTAAAALSLSVHFPNALVPRALQLHRLRGYLDAAAKAEAQP